MNFIRLLDLRNRSSSAFIFGPRMTGKTTLLRLVESSHYFDLLDPAEEMRYRHEPRLFWEQVQAFPPQSVIVVDEIQKIPELLNYVQMGIDQFGHRFLLSGSSARKLKRGGANLLGGRALDCKLFPLTIRELNGNIRIDDILQYGSLPRISTLIAERDIALVNGLLKSYVTTYIKEEIQAEALTRNIGAFQRFLSIAAQSNAQIIEFANIFRECSVPMSTVKTYYQILEDTQLGSFLWPFDHNERKKSRPKFYFFDCGVTRAIQNQLSNAPLPDETGFLFETFMVNEIHRLNEYLGKSHEISFWRQRNNEIDIIVSDGHGPKLAIECKSEKSTPSPVPLNAFKARFPDVPLIVASLTDSLPRKMEWGEILPWKDAVERYSTL